MLVASIYQTIYKHYNEKYGNPVSGEQRCSTLETQLGDIMFSRLCTGMLFLIVEVIRQW